MVFFPKASGLPGPCRAARSPGHQGRLVSRRAALQTYFLENDDSHMVPNCWRSSHSRLTHSSYTQCLQCRSLRFWYHFPGTEWAQRRAGGEDSIWGAAFRWPLLGMSNSRRGGMEERWDAAAQEPTLPAQLQRCLLAVKVTGGNPQLTCAFFCWSISCLFSGTWMNYGKKKKKKQKIKKITDFASR